ncbi:MAG TPA: EamA family transporter RarD [Vicinamibacteria bacterium]|nr:EamA family transporter RarD [Vicinamibacteria bacterium]
MGRPSARGLGYGVAAYGLWGFMPLYLKALRAVPVLEVLCHRVVWAVVFVLPLVWQQGQLTALLAAVRRRRTLAILATSTLAIAVNWLVYIWAVVHGRVLEASLGYYITPLVNVLLGVAILGERLDRTVRVAVACAAVGVGWLTLRVGQPPWIALTLATSFGLYGLMRKLAPVGALAGLAIETTLLLPFCGGYLAWAILTGHSSFLVGRPGLDVLLLLAGPVTAIPLLCFAGAARRLPLTTMGFLQYISPTLQFLLAVLVYGETFDLSRTVAFAFIWTALAVFAVYSARRGAPEPVTDA